MLLRENLEEFASLMLELLWGRDKRLRAFVLLFPRDLLALAVLLRTCVFRFPRFFCSGRSLFSFPQDSARSANSASPVLTATSAVSRVSFYDQRPG